MNTKVHVEEVAIDTKEVSFRPSPEANATFQLLEEEGLKASHKGDLKNMSVLGDPATLFPKDISVYVDINLEREKDRNLPDRVKLAEEVQETVADELKSIFQGQENDGTMLCVRVLLLSDGSSSGHRWMADHGVGAAKLTLAYCLQSATGEVAMANQLYATEDCSPGSQDELCFREYTAAVVRCMARNLAGDIAEEVSNEIMHWKLLNKQKGV